jgi:hypothetical protein
MEEGGHFHEGCHARVTALSSGHGGESSSSNENEQGFFRINKVCSQDKRKSIINICIERIDHVVVMQLKEPARM